jgi:hypothetical protein
MPTKPSELHKGEASGSPFVDMPFIRFTKSLSVPETFDGADSPNKLSDQSERSVVVVLLQHRVTIHNLRGH